MKYMALAGMVASVDVLFMYSGGNLLAGADNEVVVESYTECATRGGAVWGENLEYCVLDDIIYEK